MQIRHTRFIAIIIFSALGLSLVAVANDRPLLAPQDIPSHWVQQGWATDFSRAIIPYNDVQDVIDRDSIPSIDQPSFAADLRDSGIPGNEPVIVLELNGDARAYPLRIMIWHEIVNDIVGGNPVAVTYCPLCNTSIVFDRRIDGEIMAFGTSGKLRNSDLIMYDRTSQSWWQQFDGIALAGKYAGRKLVRYPSRLLSLEAYLKQYPDGKVLRPDPRRISQLGRNPYAGYDTKSRPFLFQGTLPDDIEPMIRVVLVQGDDPFAVALPALMKAGQLTRNGLHFTWAPGQASALDTRQISAGRDVGNIDVRNAAGDPVIHEITFAFAARAFLPDLEIIQ